MGQFNRPYLNQSLNHPTVIWNPYTLTDSRVKYLPCEQPVIRNEYVRMKLSQLGRYEPKIQVQRGARQQPFRVNGSDVIYVGEWLNE